MGLDLKEQDISGSGSRTPLRACDRTQQVVRWSRISQKRDSYVAAIGSSQLDLEQVFNAVERQKMEEVLLLESRNDRTSRQHDSEGLVLLNKVPQEINLLCG